MIDMTIIANGVVPKWFEHNPAPIRLIGLQPIGHLDIGSWYWRSFNGLKSSLDRLLGPGLVNDFTLFRPEITSGGFHRQFVWVRYILGKARAVIYVGDIDDCDFTFEDEHSVILVPMNWARAVVSCSTSSGVVGIEPIHGRIRLSDGQQGRFATQSLGA